MFFRAESIGLAWELLQRLFTAGGAAPLVTPAVLITVAGSIALQFLPGTGPNACNLLFEAGAGQAACLPSASSPSTPSGPAGVAPFIYFRF